MFSWVMWRSKCEGHEGGEQCQFLAFGLVNGDRVYLTEYLKVPLRIRGVNKPLSPQNDPLNPS